MVVDSSRLSHAVLVLLIFLMLASSNLVVSIMPPLINYFSLRLKARPEGSAPATLDAYVHRMALSKLVQTVLAYLLVHVILFLPIVMLLSAASSSVWLAYEETDVNPYIGTLFLVVSGDGKRLIDV
jgi:hypothetical protein